MILDNNLVQSIREIQTQLSAEGKLYSRAQLEGFYATFRKRFGPDCLKNLDGEALLDTIHNHSDRDSLVYWLEFKNDEELPGIFGSIAGGSALKFGIYRRKETGVWMTGAPQNQRELSIEEAIQIARKHRDQLVRGAELLERLPANQSGDTSISACSIRTSSMITTTPITNAFTWSSFYKCHLRAKGATSSPGVT